MKTNGFLIMIFAFYICTIISCTKKTEKINQTTFSGNVKNESQDNVISPAYIFLGDKLLATTDISGNFSTLLLEPGEYNITCSAIGYNDKSTSVVIYENEITKVDFHMVASNETGRVYGEFHDENLYQQQLITNPIIGDWNAKELFEGVSGATIQEKTFQHEVPEIQIFIGDSLIAYTDGFGQYWIKIQCGTYPIKGICEGYKISEQTIVVIPDERIYVNFILENE